MTTEIERIRQVALERGMGAPYLCDGTCDTCDCVAWEAGDYCEVSQLPASECGCDECQEDRDD